MNGELIIFDQTYQAISDKDIDRVGIYNSEVYSVCMPESVVHIGDFCSVAYDEREVPVAL